MFNYENILVPVDFTNISKSALTKAARYSQASGSRLLIAHIADPDRTSAGEPVESVKRNSIGLLEELLDDTEIGYCEKVVEVGETIPMLLNIININEVDLVVMGTHHFTALDESRSVTKTLAENIECDILVLHK